MRRIACVVVCAAVPALATTAQARSVTLAFDAVYTHARVVDAAPAGDSVGDRQIVSGRLRDIGGHTVGTFAFVCRYVAIVAGDAHERCTGTGATHDGAIRFAGPARKSDVDHTWTFTGTSGPLRGAHGHGTVHDATSNDSVVIIDATPAAAARLPDGVVPRAPANRRFNARAVAACATEHRALRALPPFPLSDFDPLNPDPSQLPSVGQFFNGPGDARPLERTLIARLAALGAPKAGASIWRRFTRALPKLIAVQTEQTDAALAADVVRFVAAVHAGDGIVEPLSFAVRAFGVPGCDVT